MKKNQTIKRHKQRNITGTYPQQSFHYGHQPTKDTSTSVITTTPHFEQEASLTG